MRNAEDHLWVSTLDEPDILQILLCDGGHLQLGRPGKRHTIMKLAASVELDAADVQFGGTVMRERTLPTRASN